MTGRLRALLFCTLAFFAFAVASAQVSAPFILSSGPPAGQAGAAYSFAFGATGGTAPYSWSSTPGLPPGLALSATGILSGTPTTAGTFSFTVIVTDAFQRSSSRTYSLLITAVLAITTDRLPDAVLGTPYSATLAANGTAPFTWSATSSLPPGLTLNAIGVISGTPTAVGSFSVGVSVRDATGASVSKILAIQVTAPLLSVSSSVQLPAAVATQNYTTTLQAIGGVPPYRWTSQALPEGLTLNSTTGVLSGRPATAGTYSIPVQVSDAAGATASATLSLTVNAPPLVITTVPPLFNGVVNTTYAQSFSATGGTPPYTWSLRSGSIPGLTLDPASGVLRGTPSTPGTYTLVVQVADKAGLTASQSYSISVALPALSITLGAPLPNGTVGVPYSQRLNVTATGGAPPYTWAISPAIPGLAFDPSTLTLSGVPEVAGANTLTVEVRDAAGSSDRRTLSLTITPAALTLTGSRRLPNGQLNNPISPFTVGAFGGTPPYTWSANGLPAGVTIDSASGVISGTPTAAGAFTFAVTVSDAALARVSDLFTIDVGLPPIDTVSITGLPATLGAAQQYPLRISIGSPYPAPITGQAILSFAPESGPVDRTIQFSAGGTAVDFVIPTGSTTATTSVPLAVQTGTVAGTLSITLRLQAGGVDVTPQPPPSTSGQISRQAPVVRDVRVSRTSSSLSIALTAFSTAREITQITYTFAAAPGQNLQTSATSITVPVESMFSGWFQDSNNAQYGSVFVYTQPFTIQGDPAAVLPKSVTVANRSGSTVFQINE